MELKNEILKYIYILVRIPKSGSQTLREMVHKSFVGSSHFRLPRLDIDQNVDRSLTESSRRNRRLLKGVSASGALERTIGDSNIEEPSRAAQETLLGKPLLGTGLP